MGGKGEAKRARREAEAARAKEEARQAQIRSGTKRVNNIFSQFDDDFFSGQRDSYLNYANPQLEDQFGDAQRELTFALARSGNLESSARGSKVADLQKLYDLNRQQIADQGLSYESQARNNIEDARAGLISSLNATGDATQAANSAVARAQALSQPAAYAPLVDLFSRFTAGLGAQAAQERAEAESAAGGGKFTSHYHTGLFGVPNSAVRNTR